MAAARGGLAKGGMPALLAIPGRMKPMGGHMGSMGDDEGDYDDEAASADEGEGADIFRRLCEAKDAGDYAAGAMALGDFIDWYMGEGPESDEEEAPDSGPMAS